MRMILIGRNSSFSHDAMQRLGSVYGLSPGLCLPARRHLPDTVSHPEAKATRSNRERLPQMSRGKASEPDAALRVGRAGAAAPLHLFSNSAAVAESAPDRFRHCSFSGGGDHCQTEPRRSGANAQRKAQPQHNGSPSAQHRGLRPSPPQAEADCSVLETVFWLSVFVAFLVFLKWVHV